MRGIVVVLALAGCDAILHFENVPVPAPYLVCSEQSEPSFLCADFDGSGDVYYAQGIEAAMPAAMGNVAFTRTQPAGDSPPNALWVDSTGDTYKIEERVSGPAVTHLHARFTLQVARAPDTYAFELVAIGVDTSQTYCAANLQVDFGNEVLLMVLCNSRMTSIVLPVLPMTPMECDLDFDLGTHMASLTVDGHSTSLPIDMTIDPAPPLVRVGALYTQAAATHPKIGLDDVVITVE